MRADDRALADLAASVADGEPIDWQAVESGASLPDRRLVRHLRLVENISALYRSIPLEEDDGLAAIAPASAEPSGPRWGRLVLLEQIGRGSSGEVYRAWDSDLHREVALKLLKETGPGDSTADTHTRVLQEARRLARVRHPHVVQVYGAEQHDERVGLWMELVRGESLEQIVASRGPFGPGEAAVIGQDLCSALAAVHGAGLLHRDVKAQNVLRESGGRTVLMDFGTGEELREHGGSARLAGTPLYLAPEIFRGRTASVQSDIYGVGVLLFHLVTGQFPVIASSVEQLARAHAHRQSRRIRDLRPDLPSSFVRAIERALDPEPTARYQTAGEMEAALREGTGRFPEPVVTPQRWWHAARRRPAAVWAICAVLAAAVAAIVWSRGDNRVEPAATRAITSLAVLPLADVSGPSASSYFADALTDQLISTLGQIGALRVASRTSVMPFKDAKAPIEHVFKALRVDAIVEGTVNVSAATGKDADRVRLNVRLISAGGNVLWSRTFERALGETLLLQAELARAIAEGINAAVTPEEGARLRRARSTQPGAEQAYFQGLYNLNQLGADNMRAAIAAFRRTIQLDPEHAPAHAGLARAHITLGFMRITSHAEARATALQAASRASALDASSSDAHEVLADLKFYYDWDWTGAEAEYQRAIALNPSSARAHGQYARYLIARGRSAAALEAAQRAVALDPLSAGAASTEALMRYYTRDYDRALHSTTRALELDPRSAGVYFVMSRIHAARGALPEAIDANERAVDLAGRAATGWHAQRVALQARSGDVSQARTALAELSRTLEARKERLGPGQLAYIHLALGDRQRALQLLERGADDRDPELLWLAVDPRVDELRTDPRFQRLLATLSLPALDPSMRLP